MVVLLLPVGVGGGSVSGGSVVAVGGSVGDVTLFLAFSRLPMCDSRNFKIIFVDYEREEGT